MTHPHREVGVAGQESAFREPPAQLPEADEPGTDRLRIGVERRHQHEPGEPQAGQSGYLFESARQGGLRDSELGGLASQVHLRQDPNRRTARRDDPLADHRAQPGRQGHAVHRLDHRKESRGLPRLVALEMSDQVRRDRSPEAGELRGRLLNPVLAEVGEPERRRRLDVRGRPRLRYRHETDPSLGPAGAAAALGDPVAHRGDALGERGLVHERDSRNPVASSSPVIRGKGGRLRSSRRP